MSSEAIKKPRHEGVPQIPPIGLGTWKASEEEVEKIVYEALKTGYRHIDCAAYYKNQKGVGKGIKKAIDEGIVKRQEIWVTSKLWPTHGTREKAREMTRRTLDELGLEYLDLYLIHWPIPFTEGPKGFYGGDVCAMGDDGQPIIQRGVTVLSMWKIMEEFYEEGLTRYIGLCNCPSLVVTQVFSVCKIHPYANQIEQSPFCQSSRHVEFCLNNDIRVISYSPLGGSGSGKDGAPSLLEHPLIKKLAKKYDCTEGEIVLSWNISRSPGHISVIPKTSNPKRLAPNLHSQEIHLSKEDMTQITDLEKEIHFRATDPWKLWKLPIFQ